VRKEACGEHLLAPAEQEHLDPNPKMVQTDIAGTWLIQKTGMSNKKLPNFEANFQGSQLSD
jgi:hypothetical protein